MRILKLHYSAPMKLNMLQKEIMARGASRLFPVYLVNEFPKSGGTWLKYMLGDALDVPPWIKDKIVWQTCVLQGHWINPRGKCKTVILYRDARDVMVSYYYHCFFINEFHNQPLVNLMRKHFKFEDYNDIRSNLLSFMKDIYYNPITPNFRWLDFVNAWWGQENIVTTRYEDLRSDTTKELQRIVFSLTGKNLQDLDAKRIADKFSIENMRKHQTMNSSTVANKQNAQISFIRKGSVGGWQDIFDDEALFWFEEIHGDALTRLGYRVKS